MDEQTYKHLKEVQASQNFALKPISLFRDEITDLSGKSVPFKLRYYQAIGVYTLLTVRRMILGDATGIGKTAQIIGTLCYLWGTSEKNNKAIVVCPKSAVHQWAGEILKFTKGVKPFIVPKEPKQREKVYSEWFAYEGPAVLVLGYAVLLRDWDAGAKMVADPKDAKKKVYSPGLLERLLVECKDIVTVFDECTAFKSEKTKCWSVCGKLSALSKRCYGLTATLRKNRLEEGFAIYKVIVPPLFGSKTAFLSDYAVVKLQRVGGTRMVPIVVGYKNIPHFRQRIDPYFLGRAKHMVSSELPFLITKELNFNLSAIEDSKYSEALEGLISLGDGDVKDYTETAALSSLIYCQKVVNSLTLLRFEEEQEVHLGFDFETSLNTGKLGSKETALVELMVDELADEKTIIYTRFASLVPRLQEILLRECKLKSVAITGQVQDKKRRAYQEQFQDMNSDVSVIFITDAGSEALNLQAASAMVFFDAPWSWGTYVQLLGRPIRIGSPNQSVVCYHLVSQRGEGFKDRDTIDSIVLKTLGKKKALIDKVLGATTAGALEFEDSGSDVKNLIRELQKTAKK